MLGPHQDFAEMLLQYQPWINNCFTRCSCKSCNLVQLTGSVINCSSLFFQAQCAIYWLVLYNLSSWTNHLLNWDMMIVCLCMSAGKAKNGSASVLRREPWQQHGRQSNRVLESCNTERVDGATERYDGAPGRCRGKFGFMPDWGLCITLESALTQQGASLTFFLKGKLRLHIECLSSNSHKQHCLLGSMLTCDCYTGNKLSLLLLLFPSSTQTDDRLRVERRDSSEFEFTSAMNTVVQFYCHVPEKGGYFFSAFLCST